MSSKQEVIDAVIPMAVLQAMTPEAIDAIPQCLLLGDNIIAIHSFPFRIGRESRVVKVKGRIERVDRPEPTIEYPNNDLYLLDRSPLLNVSREHLKLEKLNGTVMLIDRGSACGTRKINAESGASETGASFMLHDGDIIALGAEGSPFLYKFIVLSDLKVKVAS